MSQPCMAGGIENDVVEGSDFVQLAGFVCIKYIHKNKDIDKRI